MKEILTRLINHENLDEKESKEILIDISMGKYNHEQVASFLTVFMLRGTSTNELIGFRNALLELCVKLDFSDFETIDLCGTGGDNKNTFNISTLASFVTAGAGIHVAKHGNYSVSSACGSSNVLEYFGIKFTNEEDFLKTCLNKAHICVLHAPLFHPAMKNVAPVRKALGMKTFFNILGPLVNPCRPNNQLVGVYGLDILRLYKSVFETTKGFKYSIVHSLDGYDEISLTGDSKVVSNNNELLIKPKDFDSKIISPEKIFGGNTIEQAASIFLDVLNLRSTKEQTDVVLANSALAISTAKEIGISEAFDLAKDSLLSKKALKSFNTLIELSK